jgi:hypothetical protein
MSMPRARLGSRLWRLFAPKLRTRLPAEIDLQRLEDLMAAKLAEAEYVVLALREDPAFFKDTYTQLREHARVDHNCGNAHTRYDAETVAGMWIRFVNRIEAWAYIHGQIQHMRQVKAELFDSGKVSPGQDLPHDLSVALYTVILQLEKEQMPCGVLDLITKVKCSPAMRHMFDFVRLKDISGGHP